MLKHANNESLRRCKTQRIARSFGCWLLMFLWLFVPSAAGHSLSLQESDGKQPPAQEPESPVEAPAVTNEVEWKSLMQPELEKQWKSFPADAIAATMGVWKITRETPEAEPVLVCMGHPKGFLMTLDEYSDFELTLEWKIPSDQNGNSGVLVFAQDEPRIWPTAMQVQFHQPKAGSIFPSGDAKSDNTSESDLARPIGMWNECRIVSTQGRLSVEINGKKGGDTTGSVPAAGRIALQSEGAEVHFRRMKIRRLSPSSPTLPEPDPEKAVENSPAATGTISSP